nr:MAG: hypothetical protein DIU60_21075 [Actinomycetota bacterium]
MAGGPAVKPRVFRSKGAFVLGWIWLAFAALNAVDLIVRGRMPSSLVAGAVLGVLTAVIYVTCLRPGIFLREDGVLVRNPLRDAFVPWAALGDVRVTHAILIESGGRTIRSWTPQVSNRELIRMARSRPAGGGRDGDGDRDRPGHTPRDHAEAVANRTHAHWVAEQIVEESARARGRSGDAAGTLTVTWSPAPLAALGAALLLVAAAVLASL